MVEICHYIACYYGRGYFLEATSIDAVSKDDLERSLTKKVFALTPTSI
jgi:hypothetical protein